MFLKQKGDYAMNSPAQYLHIGFILISMANLIVIALLIVVFVLAVALRLPEKQHLSTLEAGPEREETAERPLAEVEISS
jgi:NADH:ubiquinone oxidoreductase subunit 3 (subunit A)